MNKTRDNGKKCNVFDGKLDKFVFTQPTKLVLENKSVELETWVDLIDNLCALLSKRNNGTLQEFLEDEKKRKNRIAYLAAEEQTIHFVKYLPKSGLYLNQKIDAPRSVKLISKLLDKFKIGPDDFGLYVKEC